MKVWQRILLGIASAILVCVITLVCLEGALRWMGYGYPTSFFVEDPNTGLVVENERFVWQFLSSESHLKPHPFRFEATKKPDVIRIFILGESAALGTPEPAFGFGRVLERILKHRYPDQPIEVINLAMRGINSHMIRVVARECVAYDPSLIIFYGGNNELAGWQAPGPDSSGPQSLEWIRFQQFLRASKSGQLIRSMVSSFRPNSAPEQDMAFFHDHRLHPDDARRKLVADRYSQNLKDAFEAVLAHNIPLLVGGAVVNERDCPPLGSLHPESFTEEDTQSFDRIWKEAIQAESSGDWSAVATLLQKASQLDNRFAELHYRLARALEQSNDLVGSRLHYQQAKDCDALPFRSDSSINAALKQVVDSLKTDKITLIDFDHLFRTHPYSMNEVPGSAFFYEHVHFRFNGDYIMASYLFPYVQQILDLPRKEPSVETAGLLSLVECAKQLGYNPVLEAMMVQSMIQLQKGPPFLDQVDHAKRIEALENDFQKRYGGFGPAHFQGAIKWVQDAMGHHPEDWNLPFLAARIAARLKDYELAISYATKARDLMPHATLTRTTLTHYLLQSGKKAQAREELNKALERFPDHPEVQAILNKL
jgi:tetratricopeptide (TPR) repeat protein